MVPNSILNNEMIQGIQGFNLINPKPIDNLVDNRQFIKVKPMNPKDEIAFFAPSNPDCFGPMITVLDRSIDTIWESTFDKPLMGPSGIYKINSIADEVPHANLGAPLGGRGQESFRGIANEIKERISEAKLDCAFGARAKAPGGAKSNHAIVSSRSKKSASRAMCRRSPLFALHKHNFEDQQPMSVPHYKSSFGEVKIAGKDTVDDLQASVSSKVVDDLMMELFLPYFPTTEFEFDPKAKAKASAKSKRSFSMLDMAKANLAKNSFRGARKNPGLECVYELDRTLATVFQLTQAMIPGAPVLDLLKCRAGRCTFAGENNIWAHFDWNEFTDSMTPMSDPNAMTPKDLPLGTFPIRDDPNPSSSDMNPSSDPIISLNPLTKEKENPFGNSGNAETFRPGIHLKLTL